MKHEYGLIRFIQRKQGLILAAGNPHKISSLQDLSLQSVKFVNRQHNSGTRFLLDQFLTTTESLARSYQWLHQRGVLPTQPLQPILRQAWLAQVLGLSKPLRQFGLDFIALCHEEYLFAYKKRRSESAHNKTVSTAALHNGYTRSN